jgi:flagellar motility protein MotE (MotC chaperone)
VNKKVIIIAAVVGLASFAGAFATGWFTRPTAAAGASEPNQSAAARARDAAATGSLPQVPPPTLSPTLTMPTGQNSGTRSMTEEQLKELIIEVREKIQQYNQKLAEVEKEKERLQIAQQTLKKDIEALNNLRVDLAASVADVKSEREMLLKARVEVAVAEKANLLAIAAAYDKMDPVGAGQILTNMATGASKNGNAGASATNLEDAVKILFFMQDRTKAKVLAEMANQEPALAALLSQKLKQVQEGK